MDFIERLLHIAPDNGSGLTEVAIFAALFAALCLTIRAYRKRRGSFCNRQIGSRDAPSSLRLRPHGSVPLCGRHTTDASGRRGQTCYGISRIFSERGTVVANLNL